MSIETLYKKGKKDVKGKYIENISKISQKYLKNACLNK